MADTSFVYSQALPPVDGASMGTALLRVRTGSSHSKAEHSVARLCFDKAEEQVYLDITALGADDAGTIACDGKATYMLSDCLA